MEKIKTRNQRVLIPKLNYRGVDAIYMESKDVAGNMANINRLTLEGYEYWEQGNSVVGREEQAKRDFIAFGFINLNDGDKILRSDGTYTLIDYKYDSRDRSL